MHLVPPMAEEPPPEFTTFVVAYLPAARADAERLLAGAAPADEVYPAALADVAGHWRRLRLRGRVTGRDPAPAFLARRVAGRARRRLELQARDADRAAGRAAAGTGPDDGGIQVYAGFVPPRRPAPRATPVSAALRRAAVLDGTARSASRPVAEAAIAWTQAWRRAETHRLVRVAGTAAAVFLALAGSLPTPPG